MLRELLQVIVKSDEKEYAQSLSFLLSHVRCRDNFSMKELGAYNFFVDRGGLLYASAQLIPFLKLIIENITATLASSIQDLHTAIL